MRLLRAALLLTPFTTLSALELPPLPEAVTSFGAVISGGKLYTYGGHQAGSHSWSLSTTSGKLHRHDLATDGKWEELPGGPAVQSPGVAEYAGKIYLVGGMQPQNEKGQPPVLKSLNHAQVFDPATRAWTPLPNLPEPRSSHDIAILEGKLYVVGGWPLDTSKDSKKPDDRDHVRLFHQTMLVLDLTTPGAAWETVPQPFQRRALAVAAGGGRIYAIGGMDEKNEVSASVDVYDTATRIWSKAPDLPAGGKVKGFAAAACVLRGEIIASPRGGKIEVWIEDTPEGKLVVRFAEYGEEYEKSPGHLDALATPEAWTSGADGKPKTFAVEKKADHYLLVDARPEQGVQAEAAFAIMKRGDSPARKPIFYARWHHAKAGAATPALTFDIVPTGITGEVQVWFRGKPLPEAKITLVPPAGKEQELVADKEGKAKFTADKPGNYLLYGKHQREDTPGFSGGVAYAAVSHNCSLLWKEDEKK